MKHAVYPHRRPLALLLCLLGLGAFAPVTASSKALDSFIAEMGREHQFDGNQLRMVLNSARVKQDILKAISHPAEKLPWHRYRPIFVTQGRIQEGVRFWREHQDLLDSAAERFGVEPEIIVAIIGVETRYGRHTGRYRVLDSLYTLGFHYPPRSDFFRSELKHFLLLAREERLDPRDLKGSYAGAMGQPQFISSSYRSYAVDFDGDGRRNLWSDRGDVIGSVANYFARHGWQRGAPIAYPAQIKGDDLSTALHPKGKPQMSWAQMRALGIHTEAEIAAETRTALIELEQRAGPEHWVTLKNFYVITRYNHSPLYAMAVYQLSQAIKQQYLAADRS